MSAPRRIAFLLLERYSLLCLAYAREALRAADQWLGGRSIESLLLSREGRPALSASGEALHVHAALGAAPPALDALVVVAEQPPEAGEHDFIDAQLNPLVHAVLRRQGRLIGLGCGVAWFARSGALDGRRVAVPALHAPALASLRPAAIVSRRSHEMDAALLSASTGAGTLALMLAWIESEHGEACARAIKRQFGSEAGSGDSGKAAAVPSSGLRSSKLEEALSLMSANLGEPLSTEDIAGLVGVSRRQLERLFKQHLDTLPARWYLEQRLERARRLLIEGSQSILQIGLSCGFTSGAHFSNAYRQHYGHTPREERSARAEAWRALAEPLRGRKEPSTP